MDAATTFFHAVGYLRVPGVIGSEECDNLCGIADRIGAIAHDDHVVNRPDSMRINHAVATDSAFLAAATSDPLISRLVPIIGSHIELVENRHNHLSVYRSPRVDRLHRDVLQWSRSILTVLVYLSDCTDLESATRVIPGSHLWPSTGAPNNGGTWLDQSAVYSMLSEQAVPVPASAGDVILMHGQLYHAGAGASASGPRTVLTLAYRSVDELSADEFQRYRLVKGQRIYRGREATSCLACPTSLL
ncbi:phytanoyl-CoA dioxygenase family protein [Parafrankia discariae]|uniref:phytanoyl-CoA dioxygenase family protein n=1 Tax=Parafrankia discariae TaxID=365528 RepID=UPI0009780363